MNILIAGGSGFLGRALGDRLAADGHRIVVLTRGRAVAGRPWADPRASRGWAPDGGVGEWADLVGRADAIVNLAGESIGDGRWSDARKRAILDSRVLATRSLVSAIREAKRSPAVFVSASAQGYYGDRGDEELTEAAPSGTGFLAEVCRSWEAEARRAEAGARVVLLRTGLVLAAHGGALPPLVRLFRLFVGGPLGSGRQFMSWIHIDDWTGIVCRCIDTERAHGPRNLGAPHPVRNREFAAALGRALRRPAFVPAPRFALRAVLGQMADPLLLASTRMVPAGPLGDGYRFGFEKVEEALLDVL